MRLKIGAKRARVDQPLVGSASSLTRFGHGGDGSAKE